MHLGNVLVGQRVVGRHDLCQAQQIGQDTVDLVGLEGLGRVPGHGAVDVVEQRGDGCHLHDGRLLGHDALALFQALDASGLDVVFRGAANDGREHLVGLTERAVAGSALALPHRLAQRDTARTGRQTFEVRTHIDVPGLHLGGSGVTAHVVPRRGLRKGRTQ
ncbi:hypothetical protein D9M68_845900 [compost metagenome]